MIDMGFWVKKGFAILTALVVAVSPAYGAICTMECGTGGSSCCCQPQGYGDGAALSNPSCCGQEVNSNDGADQSRDRTRHAARYGQAAESAAAAAEIEFLEIPGVERSVLADAGTGEARSSPLFLLNSSFII